MPEHAALRERARIEHGVHALKRLFLEGVGEDLGRRLDHQAVIAGVRGMTHPIRFAVAEEERAAGIGDDALPRAEVPDEHAAERQHEPVAPAVLHRPAGVIVRPAADQIDLDRGARVGGADVEGQLRGSLPYAVTPRFSAVRSIARSAGRDYLSFACGGSLPSGQARTPARVEHAVVALDEPVADGEIVRDRLGTANARRCTLPLTVRRTTTRSPCTKYSRTSATMSGNATNRDS